MIKCTFCEAQWRTHSRGPRQRSHPVTTTGPSDDSERAPFRRSTIYTNFCSGCDSARLCRCQAGAVPRLCQAGRIEVPSRKTVAGPPIDGSTFKQRPHEPTDYHTDSAARKGAWPAPTNITMYTHSNNPSVQLPRHPPSMHPGAPQQKTQLCCAQPFTHAYHWSFSPPK